MGGFAMAFAGSDSKLRFVIYLLAFGPVGIAVSVMVLLSNAASSPFALAMIGIGLCLCYFAFFLGRMLGKPFFEIWRERQDNKLKETFK